MSTGSYGVIRGATPDISDIEIFYTFSPSRESVTTGSVNRLNPADVLQSVQHPDSQNQILGGLYSLKLPATNFNLRGFYNIVIRPKEFKTKIVDCGVLAALPDIKGLVLDTLRSELSDLQNKFTTGSLTGYRVEYLDNSGAKIPNRFVIITSNNSCSPITENLSNVTQKSVKYRIDSSGSLNFLTVTPSSSSSVQPNLIPNIGQPNTDIIISNTFFNPLHLEIELTEFDLNSIAIGLFSNQVKDLGSGLRSIYTFNDEIYQQFNEFEIKDEFNQSTHEVRQRRETLDNSQNFSDIIKGL